MTPAPSDGLQVDNFAARTTSSLTQSMRAMAGGSGHTLPGHRAPIELFTIYRAQTRGPISVNPKLRLDYLNDPAVPQLTGRFSTTSRWVSPRTRIILGQ